MELQARRFRMAWRLAVASPSPPTAALYISTARQARGIGSSDYLCQQRRAAGRRAARARGRLWRAARRSRPAWPLAVATLRPRRPPPHCTSARRAMRTPASAAALRSPATIETKISARVVTIIILCQIVHLQLY